MADNLTTRVENEVKLSRRTSQELRSFTANLRTDFAAQRQAVETAARDWGIRPDYPEGVFVSAILHTQAGFSDLALSLADGLQALLEEARSTAEEELARQRVVLQQTKAALQALSGAQADMEAKGKLALERLELEKTKVTTQLIERIVPDMIRGVKEAIVIKERRYNHTVEFNRAVGIGGAMLGLVVLGYAWGTWGDWGMSSRVEKIGFAIEKCQLTSRWHDDHDRRLCVINDFQ